VRTALFLSVLFAASACSRAPEVLIDGELLVGEMHEDTSIAVFRGVPFAEPPIDDLRWRAPQPLTTKQERRDAKEFAAACMQPTRILDWYRYMAETFGASGDYYPDLEIDEDCLYLNVWTPELSTDAALPVMVYVHGGSNKSGWSYEKNYHGHALAARGVVVVSITYRLGVFGFLSHPEMDPDEPQSNFGIWDAVAALRWVQDNIRQFGGDPDRVTLLGESSGAQDVLAILFARPAAGLIHRVILQSTAGYGIERMTTVADEKERGVALARRLGVEGPGSLERLRRIPADQLLQVYEQAFSSYYHSPAIDQQLFSDSTWASIEAGNFGELQMLAGTNRDEWLDYIDIDATADEVIRTAHELKHLNPEEALAEVISEPSPRRAMDRLITADNYVCASQRTAKRLSESGGSSWMYFFSRVRQGAGGEKLGAYHGAELPYVFGTHDAYTKTTEVDLNLSAVMMGYWAQFAATGDPNADGLPHWPEYLDPDYSMLEFGDEIAVIPSPEPGLCALFEDWAAKSAVAPNAPD
jgi:para-nitrobenzyl esterase